MTLSKLIRKYNTLGSVLDFKKPIRPLRGRLVANIADEVHRIIDRMPQELNGNVMANFIERVKARRAIRCGRYGLSFHLSTSKTLVSVNNMCSIKQINMCIMLN